MEVAKEHLKRTPLENTAKVWINPDVKDFYDYKLDDVVIYDYQSLTALKYPVSE